MPSPDATIGQLVAKFKKGSQELYERYKEGFIVLINTDSEATKFSLLDYYMCFMNTNYIREVLRDSVQGPLLFQLYRPFKNAFGGVNGQLEGVFVDDDVELETKLKHLEHGETYVANLKQVVYLKDSEKYETQTFFHGTSIANMENILCHGLIHSEKHFSRIDMHTGEPGVEGVYVSPNKECARGYAEAHHLPANCCFCAMIHVEALDALVRTHRWSCKRKNNNHQKCFHSKDLVIKAVEFIKTGNNVSFTAQPWQTTPLSAVGRLTGSSGMVPLAEPAAPPPPVRKGCCACAKPGTVQSRSRPDCPHRACSPGAPLAS